MMQPHLSMPEIDLPLAQAASDAACLHFSVSEQLFIHIFWPASLFKLQNSGLFVFNRKAEHSRVSGSGRQNI